MKISIDCRFIGKSGIGTYIENIVDCLLNSHNNHEYLLITDNRNFKSNLPNVSFLYTTIKPFSIKELFFFPVKEINQTDAFFSPYINIPFGIKVPVFSTIHDVIFLDLPGIVGPIGKIVRKFFLWYSYKKSKTVFTVSYFSKSRINYYFGYSTPVVVTYCGISKSIKDINLEVSEKLDYFVYVGNVKKHKGLGVLINAFNAAKEVGLLSKLYIVGDNTKFRSSDKEFNKLLESSRDIEFTGFISNERMFNLISNAKALILPSFYEGLGLPPMEALYLGTNVIISDIEVFKEIYKGLPVHFFNTGDSDQLKRILLNFIPLEIDKNSIKQIVDKKYNFSIITEKIVKEITKNS